MSKHPKRTRRVLALTLSLAGLTLVAGACGTDDRVVPSAPAASKAASTADARQAAVLQQVARWAIANGYTGLSPLSLHPISTTSDG
jgi:hypothetical protein